LHAHRGKAIVWCRFVRDALNVATALEKEFPGSTAYCVGSTAPEDRVSLRTRFNDPDSPIRFWVGTLATGGVGVDLGAASLMVFYSHGYDLAQRLQGLERNYGDSQRANRVEVVDLIAADTVDEKILGVLDRKEDLARRLTTLGLRDLLTGKEAS
jgi:SNF2 family DNA or RNA helicase